MAQMSKDNIVTECHITTCINIQQWCISASHTHKASQYCNLTINNSMYFYGHKVHSMSNQVLHNCNDTFFGSWCLLDDRECLIDYILVIKLDIQMDRLRDWQFQILLATNNSNKLKNSETLNWQHICMLITNCTLELCWIWFPFHSSIIYNKVYWYPRII